MKWYIWNVFYIELFQASIRNCLNRITAMIIAFLMYSIMLTYSVVEKQSARLNSKLPGAVFPAQRVVFSFCFAPLPDQCSNFERNSMYLDSFIYLKSEAWFHVIIKKYNVPLCDIRLLSTRHIYILQCSILTWLVKLFITTMELRAKSHYRKGWAETTANRLFIIFIV